MAEENDTTETPRDAGGARRRSEPAPPSCRRRHAAPAEVADARRSARPSARAAPRPRKDADARQPRTPEERHAERVAERAARRPLPAASSATARGRRPSAAELQAAATPPREHEPGVQKTRQGVVVSDSADKTITVRIDIARRHRRYEKIVRTSQHAARPRREQRRPHRRHRDRARVPAAVADQALAAGRSRGAGEVT